MYSGSAKMMSETQNGPYAGMTVNERLVVAGLLDEIASAMRRRDKQPGEG
jgi:hypothetical protein